MKPPLSYYGGKLQLASKIVPLIPEHKIYCEPFIGGAAVFFAKNPARVEIINDINSELINFYEVLQQDFLALQSEISISLHSRKQHRHAQVIYINPDMFNRIKRAWAVWVLANLSFNHSLTGGFTSDNEGKISRAISSKRLAFREELAERFQNVQIECSDALSIIRSKDSNETFFYIDPPYVGACQGHYDGYIQEDFNNLIKELSSIKGKFLLSSYRNPALSEAVKMFNWQQQEFKIINHPGESRPQQEQKLKS